LMVTRAGNLFTTHTAVAAGFDKFDPDLIRKYFNEYAQEKLGLSIENLLSLGRHDSANSSEPFNMAYLAVRGSGQINGVSKLHGEVSREIFEPLFPRWPRAEVPIGAVTNGIHTPTWDSPASDAIWTIVCGKKRWHDDGPAEDDVRQISNAQLWQMRTEGRKFLIDRIRKRYARQLASQGAKQIDVSNIFDENVLTLGFARRFATYKRPNLLLHDPERLIRLLTHQQRPMQLVIAGKAHPQDLPGQALIKQWSDFIQHPEIRGRVIFLSDYDMMMTQELVQGVDLWINTPRRPWEACGTSGMKVLVNGGLNLSELDGWWAEAYSADVGWALGDGKEHGDDPRWDAVEAEALYKLLETEVAPEFYEHNEEGVPTKWLYRIRESMAQLTAEFSANRAIREYAETHYLPAADGYINRADKGGALGANLLQWKQDIDRHWSSLRFDALDIETRDGQHFFRVSVSLGRLNPDQLKVELYADPVQGSGPAFVAMTESSTGTDSTDRLIYSAQVPASRPASDYTVRIIPYHPSASVPLETGQILWQR
jgi:glycogen phosphorylase